METSHFLIYRASAGSGKTFMLALKYIEILLGAQQPDYHRHIVAITFTNKATAEMKERILRYLYLIWTQQKNPETERIIEHLQNKYGYSEEEIAHRCGDFLKNILHQYSRFYVSTIDSFFSRIVRTFQHELNLPDGYQIQIDQELVVEHLLFMFYQSLQSKHGETVLSYVKDLVFQQMDEEGRWNIDYLLSRIIYRMLSESPETAQKTVSQNIQKMHSIHFKLLQQRNELSKKLTELTNEFVNIAEENALTDNDFPGKSRGLYAYMRRIKESQQHQTYAVMFECIKQDYKWGHINKGLEESFRNIVKEYLKTYLNYAFYQLFIQQFPKLSLLEYFTQLLRDYQQKHQEVVISEISKIVGSIVQNEHLPYIYERYGELFHHYFIDEFQDTSVLQWTNFLPLVHESLSKGFYVMLFGDAKQAIYRFRNSEVDLFINLPNIDIVLLPKEQKDEIERKLNDEFFDMLAKGVLTNTNYRSLKAIVDFNNKHFEWIANQFGKNYQKIQNAYNGLQQVVGRKHNSGKNCRSNLGLVQLYAILKEKKQNRAENKQKMLKMIHSIIEQKKLEGYQYSDITVLIRSNADCQLTAQYLLQNHIPVISADSLALYFSPKVRFLVNMMRLVENGHDEIALAGVLSYFHTHYIQNTKLEELLEQFFSVHQDIHNKQEILERYIKEHFQIEFSFAEAYVRPVDSLITYLLEMFQLHQKIDPYVMTFYELVNQYMMNNRPCSLRDVLMWWDKTGKNISILMPEKVNAVQVMTIHKSKGLQFPVVIYPFANYRLLGGIVEKWFLVEKLPELFRDEFTAILDNSVHYFSMTSGFLKKLENFSKIDDLHLKRDIETFSQAISLEEEKQILDSLNIHYVAMTRAMDELHVIFLNEDKTDKKNAGDKISDVGELLIKYLKHLKDEGDDLKKAEYEGYDIYTYGERFDFINGKQREDVHSNAIEEQKYIDRMKNILESIRSLDRVES